VQVLFIQVVPRVQMPRGLAPVIFFMHIVVS